MKDSAHYADLVRELCRLPEESEWVEFKVGNDDPQAIGEYISALSNSAALNGKPHGYLVWGVQNQTHEIVGTTFSPLETRKGNEPLETWLLRLLTPRIRFRFIDLEVDGRHVALLEIERANVTPVQFSGREFVRIGSVKKPLKEVPDRERELWRVFDRTPFEDLVAREKASGEDVVHALDFPAYFGLLERPLPDNNATIISALEGDRLIRRCEAGGWDITNLGAILFARRLADFRSLARKTVRVIQYRGRGREDARSEQVGVRGYASGFEGLVGYINGLIPRNEVVGQALRQEVPMFPELAVRELVANALIHQDFTITGAGPLVEIFEDRIEITNPGDPLVDPHRFVDLPPRSRNESLASLMRRFGICEERGSGIDKVVFQVELFQLPAPLFEAPRGSTRVVLFAHKPLSEMDPSDRTRACYLHACLKYVVRDYLTNSSLRQRFGIKERNKATASRYIREAVEGGYIKLFDPEAPPRLRKYVPYWA